MKELFPEFDWAGTADAFLAELQRANLSITEQMRRRKIVRLEIKPLLCNGGIKIEKGYFVVVFNYETTLEEKMETLGHEIGHTFHYDLVPSEPCLLCSKARESEDVFNRLEEFCRIFAKRWLKLNSVEEIRKVIGI
jgi:hypothetical protein